MATTYLTRTPSSTGNRKIFTISAWIKRSKTGNNQKVITAGTSGTEGGLQFSTGTGENCLKFYEYVGSEVISIAPNRILRDTSAWYHVVIAVDTTQATASNRVKYYLNGVQETSFATATYPSQNYDTLFNNSGTANTIGFLIGHSAYFDGYMSHIHFIDGTAYDASAFGETDATTGEWTIKTSPSVTYGNNGFFILKDGNSVTDQSGNGNNFTVAGGTLTDTLDCPDNVFATLNPLDNIASSTFSEGNNTVTTVNSNSACNTSTLGAISGKYYWEVKMTAGESNQESYIIGLVNASPNVSGYDGSIMALGFGLRGNGNINGIYGQTTGWNTFAVNDIINIAVDFDNGKAYFGTNGSWGNSSNPSTGTNGYSFTVGSEFWRMAVNCRETSKDGVFKCNFGNGYFGTTAVSSAGTNASGNGIFEYDVPTGYTALSTKGLNL
jgi:hypothetical protein